MGVDNGVKSQKVPITKRKDLFLVNKSNEMDKRICIKILDRKPIEKRPSINSEDMNSPAYIYTVIFTFRSTHA